MAEKTIHVQFCNGYIFPLKCCSEDPLHVALFKGSLVKSLDFRVSNEKGKPVDLNCSVQCIKEKLFLHFEGALEQDWFTFWKSEGSEKFEQSSSIELDKCFNKYLEVGDQLFMREAYSKLFELIMEYLKSFANERKSRPIVVVQGTPGVGKTFFLFYMLYKFRKEKNRNVVVTIGEDNLILDCEVPRFGDAKKYLADHPEAIYLHDPQAQHVPPIKRCLGVTIITTSVDDNILLPLKHLKKKIFFMPIWTHEELQHCRKLCYNDICKENVVKEHFFRWGGSARNVFTTCDEDLNKKFFSILKEVNTVPNLIARLESTMHDSDSRKKFQWLRHMVVSDDFTNMTYKWPSNYIRQMVIMGLKSVESTFLSRMELLANASYIKSGNLYGDYVTHRLLADPTRQLIAKFAGNTDSKRDIKINIPPTYCLFANTDIIQQPNDSLYIPLEKNKASIDFIMIPFMLQITVARKHSLNPSGLEAIKTAFPSVKGSDWKICFVIPTRNISSFTYPKNSGHDIYTLCFDYGEKVEFQKVCKELEMCEDKEMGTGTALDHN